MILRLDHAQRLNLKQLIGNLPAGLDNIRSYWALMDRLALSDEEKEVIEYYEQVGPPPALQRSPSWNPEKCLPKKEFDLSNFDVETVRTAMKMAQFLSGPSRGWLEDLMEQLDLRT